MAPRLTLAVTLLLALALPCVARAEPTEHGEWVESPPGLAVQTWDRVQVGADVSQRWQFMGGLRFGMLLGRRNGRAGFFGAGPSVGLRTTRFDDVSGSLGVASVLALRNGYQARLELEYGRSDARGRFVASTLELGMGIAFHGRGRYAHRVGGGLALTYIRYVETDEEQVFFGFSVQTFVALIAPLFIQP